MNVRSSLSPLPHIYLPIHSSIPSLVVQAMRSRRLQNSSSPLDPFVFGFARSSSGRYPRSIVHDDTRDGEGTFFDWRIWRSRKWGIDTF